MSKIKVVRAEEEYLEFSDGSTITSHHDVECCEYNYADFTQIDDLAREWEFEHPILFEKSEYGFRFGNKDKMVFVPCYSIQSGYYSYSVEIYYNGKRVFEPILCSDKEDEEAMETIRDARLKFRVGDEEYRRYYKDGDDNEED